MGRRARTFFLLLGVATVGTLLILVASRQLYTRGVQGEAKLMMSYIHTLERVYKLENSEYVYWDAFYGANAKGVDSCPQPEGAAEVGLLIAGCHRELVAPPRYAYRVLKVEPDRYRIEARSGSDQAGRSVVCFQPEGDELWESSQNMEYLLKKSCD